MVLTETTVVIWAEESRTSSCDRHSSDDGASAKTRKPSLRYMPAPSQTSFNLRSNNNGECKHNQYHEAAHCGAIKTPTVFKAYSEQKLQSDNMASSTLCFKNPRVWATNGLTMIMQPKTHSPITLLVDQNKKLCLSPHEDFWGFLFCISSSL